jgi:hypothetical protein
MADGRKNNGAKKGVYQGQGRKPKADELKLIEELSIYDDIAKKCLEDGIRDGNYQFWNKFMEYRYGKPKERVDVTSNDETLNLPIINFVKTED